MSEPKQKFYLTTPIYYVNARPHIGHAYTTIAADVIARRHRLLGHDTFFLTGTDEHGQKIQRSAEAAGIPPQQFADEVSDSFRNLWKRMGITNDDYIRTTEPRHKAGVQKLWRTLEQNGFIYLSKYTGSYCVSDEAFVDAPVGTPCPDCGRLLEEVTEENYFFKLSEFQKPLLDLIDSGELKIENASRRNEVISFLRGSVQSIVRKYWDEKLNAAIATVGTLTTEQWEEAIESGVQRGVLRRTAAGDAYLPGGLKDLSISRSSFKWGIPVPGNPKQVIYVWLDALANYMTAIGYGSDDPADRTKFKHYWPAKLHLVGKEIIRFHCVYWPAFLLALNPELAGKQPDELPFEKHLAWAKAMLPNRITAHGWLLFENDKMSKSKGNIVRTETILDAFGTLLPQPTEANSADSPETASLVKGTASAVPQTTAEGAALAAEVRPSSPSAQKRKHEQDLFAADVLRYFLLREIPFGQDGSFSFDALVQRYNSDLANGYGNLVSRVLAMISQYYDGIVPPANIHIDTNESEDRLYLNAAAMEFHDDFDSYQRSEGLGSLLDSSDFDLYLENISKLIARVDGYITKTTPWKLAKSVNEVDRANLSTALFVSAQLVRLITALLYPILPYATSKVWAQLGLGDIEQAARNGELNNLQWGGLKPGTKLGPLGPIFPRAPKELIQLMNDIESANAPKSNGTKSVVALPQVNSDLDASARHRSEFAEMPIASASATPALNKVAETVHPIVAHHAEPAKPETPQIAIDDFVKVDLRVAQIVVAERIPKADKLLRLEVDLGYERRQILSGIAQWYTPEELIGRRIVVIANLAPRKMRGLESHGMLLAASKGEDDKPVLATFGEEIALGSRLK